MLLPCPNKMGKFVKCLISIEVATLPSPTYLPPNFTISENMRQWLSLAACVHSTWFFRALSVLCRLCQCYYKIMVAKMCEWYVCVFVQRTNDDVHPNASTRILYAEATFNISPFLLCIAWRCASYAKCTFSLSFPIRFSSSYSVNNRFIQI